MSKVGERVGKKIQVLTGLVLLALAVAPALAGFQENRELDATHLRVENLIGTIRVEGHAGSRFEVRVNVEGKDATPDRVRVETRESEGVVAIIFPLSESRRYVYPKLAGRSKASFTPDSDGSGRSWAGKLLAQMFGSSTEIEVSRDGSGLEIWADVVIRVPAGKAIELAHGVGDIEASGVRGSVSLSSHVGRVGVDDFEGDVVVDTGSGAVAVAKVRGKLLVDTGSGQVVVRDARGDVNVDTGSGGVKLEDCSGDSMRVDTGSGSVDVRSTRAGKLEVDTGSGGVSASGIDADNVLIDTGSGAVTLELTRMGRGRFDIDTGSGGIELRLPADASAEVRAESGSGGVEIDLGPGHETIRQDSNSATVRVGAGEARVVLDAGSGRIHIR